MTFIGLDLGGTKISGALFSERNTILDKEIRYLDNRTGDQVTSLIIELCDAILSKNSKLNPKQLNIGICVPGIAYSKTGKVWAPNIPGWEEYPLKEKLNNHFKEAIISIESDRTCYILGETSQGAAKGCDNAIFVAVGTGIGAGILIDGRVLHGASDIVGATGWMALKPPYDKEWDACGCFESHASGNGIAFQARKRVAKLSPEQKNNTFFKKIPVEQITSKEVFSAYEEGDQIAVEVLDEAVLMWGMAAANYVSLFNPEIIVFGGGVFGPAKKFIDRIYNEALKWAQPIAIKQCRFTVTELQETAGLYGAGAIARIGNIKNKLYGIQ
jgi:glucokinase